ncbi:decaprenyl-phosphate phosphoribosyltransferase [Micromonospora sp. Llam0]|uniref:decaprenyl-phosphate phosphoribosyltransferase n=1 Tax=Micromonospora sp. Llam0 TaxID=2485143 RepID=UPI000F4AB34A|nr:decaprenyl-phosphate phosphoribosyltransferase [Micromonospora sp. Llam0]ROO59061.1 decaprenyl-phosphate phosphoribosyltransferase [Micromonospora sp. Llam0]
MTIAIDQPVGTGPTAGPGPTPPPPGATRPGLLTDLITLIRPHQWAKNLLVVPLALIDAPELGPGPLARIGWAVVLFTLASSLVYVGNDVYDRRRDRAHPAKRHRPIAAGRISVPVAYAVGLALAVLLAAAVLLGPAVVWWPIAGYLVLNLAYSRGLKHLPLVDVCVVAVGFVLRVVQGQLAVGTPVGRWLLVAVFALCLLFILGKRRHEVTVAGSDHRPSLRGYSVQYLDYLIVFCAVLAVVAFLFSLQETVADPYTDLALLGSVPFAFFAVARYLQVLVVNGDGGEPTRILLRDRVMFVNALLWGVLLAGTLLAAHYAVPLDLTARLR